jgi:magnesium transporter
MILVHCFVTRQGASSDTLLLAQHQLESGEAIPKDAAWIDLIEPTREERQATEAFADLALPTPEEMDEIEPSELLYAENGVRYMTARLLCLSRTKRPKIANVSFIQKGRLLVTMRYEDPKPFQTFAQRCQRFGLAANERDAVFVGLVDAIVGRAAEVLRLADDRIDALSESIFEEAARKGRPQTREYQDKLVAIGTEGARVSKARESLVSIEMMLRFASQAVPADDDGEHPGHIHTMLHDMSSLQTHSDYLSGKVQFLLDTLLGLVNLTQNDIVKIFTVIMVVFTPPTLVASIYGMNFKNMPEYDWSFGYQYGLALMLFSAVLPYLYFRWKKWL